MDDLVQLLQGGLVLAQDGKWWALAALGIGAVIRLLKPDVRWFPNLDARWRPVALAALGIVVSGLNMVVTSNDWRAALQWGLSAAMTALMGHVFGIEVLRGGKELRIPSAPSDVSGGGASGGGTTSLPRPSKAPSFPGAAMVGLAVMLALIPGCAFLRGVSPALVQVQTDVAEAESVLQTIRSVVEIFFAEVPNPALKSKVEQGLADAELARDAILRAIDAAKSAEAGDVDTAYAKFNSAYADLYQILIDAGVVTPSGHKMGVARGHGGVRIDIPTPLTMGHARS